jgi:3-oxoadipate enol-lactonase
LLAATRPDLVRALVLSNTAARMGDAQTWRDRIDAVTTHGIAPIAPAILERWFSPMFLRKPEVALWRNMLTRTPTEGYAGCCAAIASADLTTSTGGLRLPVLGIGGSCDLASPSDLVAATTALVPGSRFVEIAGAGHLPCVETPIEHAKLLSEFILENCHD